MKNIKIIIKKPNETPFIDSIPDTLEAMQELVGGYIEKSQGQGFIEKLKLKYFFKIFYDGLRRFVSF